MVNCELCIKTPLLSEIGLPLWNQSTRGEGIPVLLQLRITGEAPAMISLLTRSIDDNEFDIKGGPNNNLRSKMSIS